MAPEALLVDMKNGRDILECPECGMLYLPDDAPKQCESCRANIGRQV